MPAPSLSSSVKSGTNLTYKALHPITYSFGFAAPVPRLTWGFRRQVRYLVVSPRGLPGALFERLGVPCERDSSGGDIVCQFTAATVRAYQLLHILLHELGHHHDRMTTRSQVRSCRGETYAEAYALKYEARMWQRYQETFGLL